MVKFPSYQELKQEISNTITIDSNFTNDKIKKSVTIGRIVFFFQGVSLKKIQIIRQNILVITLCFFPIFVI